MFKLDWPVVLLPTLFTSFFNLCLVATKGKKKKVKKSLVAGRKKLFLLWNWKLIDWTSNILNYVAWSFRLRVKTYIYMMTYCLMSSRTLSPFWFYIVRSSWISSKHRTFCGTSCIAYVKLKKKNSSSKHLNMAHRYLSWPICYKDQ